MRIKYTSNTIEIGNHSLEFPDEIEAVLTMEDKVIVLLEFGGERSPQNIIAVNENGEVSWVIDAVYNDDVMGGGGKRKKTPYTGIRAADEGLVAHNYNSGRYAVDLDSGGVTLIGWMK